MGSEFIVAEEQRNQEGSLKKRAMSAVYWFGATRTLGQMISWFIMVYVARILLPADYGLLGMALAFTGFILIFNELGLGTSLVQRRVVTREDVSNVFWIVVFMNSAFYAASFISAPYIAAFFREPRVTPVIRILAVNFLITGIGYTSYYMLAKDLLFHKRSIADFTGNLAGGLTTIYLAVKGHGVWSLVYGSVAVELVKNVLFVVFYPCRPALSFSLKRSMDTLSFGGQITAGRILWYSYSNADYIVAGRVLGKAMLGYYTMAFQFASMPLEKIVSVITQVALPAFSEIQGDAASVKRYFLKMSRIVSFVTFPLFMGIYLVADDAVVFLLTAKWASIILPLKVLCVISCLRAMNAMYSPLMIATGRPDIVMKNNLLLAIVLPVSFYIGSFYGLAGLAYSWLLSYPALFMINTRRSLKTVDIPVSEYFKSMSHNFAGTSFMVITVLALHSLVFTGLYAPVRIASTCLAGVATYLAYYLIFNRDILKESRSVLLATSKAK